MAQLPQIQYRQVSIPKGPGPGQAIARANQIAKGTEVLTQGLSGIVEAKRSYDVTKASVDVGHAVSTWERDNVNREVYTAQEVKDAGLDNQINMISGYDPKGDPIYRDVIPAHEVNTFMLEKVTNDAIAVQGSTLNPIDAKAWTTDMNSRRDAVLLGSAQVNTRKAVEWKSKEREVDIASLQADGDFGGAATLINEGYMSPGAKKEAHRINFVKSKTSEVNEGIMNANSIDDYDTLMMTTTGNPVWTEGLTSETVLRMSSSIVTQRNSSITKANKAKTDAEDVGARELLIGITEGSAGVAEVNAAAPFIGTAHHARLINAVRTQSSQGFISDASTEAFITRGIIDLRAGLHPGNFDDGVRNLQQQVSLALGTTDPTTGQLIQTISGSSAEKFSTTLASLKDFPYKTEAYTSTASELKYRILGADEGAMSFLASDESRFIYSEAIDSMRQFMEDEGGTRADLTLWQKNTMPKFLNDASRASFFGLPDGVKESAVYSNQGGVFTVDHDKTTANMKAQMTRIKTKKGISPERRAKAIADINNAVSDFEYWYDLQGSN
jgi:hypothetical protein